MLPLLMGYRLSFMISNKPPVNESLLQIDSVDTPTIIDIPVNENDTTKKEIQKSEVQINEAITKNIQALTRIKKEYADKIYDYMIRFTLFFGITFLLYVCQHFALQQPIPESVMIAFLTTTFVTVLGLVGFIIKGICNGYEIRNEQKKVNQ